MMRSLSLAVLVSCTGCGSVSLSSVKPGSSVDGVRLQAATPHTVVAVIPLDSKLELKSAVLALPSESEHYELKLKGGLFQTSSVLVEMHDNGSFKKIGMNQDLTADKALAGSAVGLASIASSYADYTEATAPKTKPNAVEKENAELLQELRNLMLKANRDAVRDGRPLPYPELLDTEE